MIPTIVVIVVAVAMLAARPYEERPKRQRWKRVLVRGQYRHVHVDDEGNPTTYIGSNEPFDG